MKIKTTGFAGVNILTKQPHIMAWSVRGDAVTARKAVADNWPPRREAATQDDRWKAAMRDGVRTRKVEIRTVK